MTNESNDRIKKIAAKQTSLENQVLKSEGSLFELLLSYWSQVRENPALIRKIFKKFQQEDLATLLNTFKLDIKNVVSLNSDYFAKDGIAEKMKEITKIVSAKVDDRLGLEASGEIIQGGYMDTLVQDQTAKRQIQQFFYRTAQNKNDIRLKVEMKELIKGAQEEGGIVSRFFKNYVYDTYQEADRLSQNDFAEKLELPAAIYTGGVIEGSRPFCIERNRKVFLRDEIALFGTPADKFGGYSNKEQGKFAGKPKDGYDPFTQCGGIACRHHWSWIAKEYAARLDKTLIIVDGKLVRKEE